mmetsp:Transcript_17135/g.37013  ORF Transcript_17135/g.37013 Transcript_17135/m.37013 type:complete len:82 (+) Transcript_17135:2111-2356(+)
MCPISMASSSVPLPRSAPGAVVETSKQGYPMCCTRIATVAQYQVPPAALRGGRRAHVDFLRASRRQQIDVLNEIGVFTVSF